HLSASMRQARSRCRIDADRAFEVVQVQHLDVDQVVRPDAVILAEVHYGGCNGRLRWACGSGSPAAFDGLASGGIGGNEGPDSMVGGLRGGDPDEARGCRCLGSANAV